MSEPAARSYFTEQELGELDGESGLQIAIALLGKVYDVSRRPDLYGSGGGYHRFAGKICTRSFALTDLEPSHIGSSEIGDLQAVNCKALREWEFRFAYEGVYEQLGSLPPDHPDCLSVLQLEEMERKFGMVVGGEKKAKWLAGELQVPRRGPATSHDAAKIAANTTATKTRAPKQSAVLSARNPAAFLYQNFLSQVECERLQKIVLRSYEGKTFSTKLRVGLAPENFPDRNDPNRLLLEKIEREIGEVTNCPPHAGEDPLMAMLTTPMSGSSPACGGKASTSSEDFHLGVHLDVNRRPFRYATAIIYLTDCVRGETVFVDDCRETKLLHGMGVLHTDLLPPVGGADECMPIRLPLELREGDKAFMFGDLRRTDLEDEARNEFLCKGLKMPPLVADKEFVGERRRQIMEAKRRVLLGGGGGVCGESSLSYPSSSSEAPIQIPGSTSTTAGCSTSLRVKPRAGQMLIFFTRERDLSLDTGSFHGGVQVRKGFKFTLQKFKELPRQGFLRRGPTHLFSWSTWSSRWDSDSCCARSSCRLSTYCGLMY